MLSVCPPVFSVLGNPFLLSTGHRRDWMLDARMNEAISHIKHRGLIRAPLSAPQFPLLSNELRHPETLRLFCWGWRAWLFLLSPYPAPQPLQSPHILFLCSPAFNLSFNFGPFFFLFTGGNGGWRWFFFI